MTDPVSDFLTRLRNASKARLDECILPHSNLKEGLAGILTAEGYVAGHTNGTDAQGHKTLIVKMKYVDGAPAITGLTRVSTPGRRLYYRYSEIPRVLNGMGISIVSTPKGVMTGNQARKENVGGELVAFVW